MAADNIIGPKTTAAATISWDRHQANRGDLSEHFSASEFRCHCGGKLPGCANVLVLRQLLESLETYRKHLGHPVHIVSGYRCPKHNAAAGGAKASQHINGTAADVPPEAAHGVVQGWRIASGMGWARAGAHAGLVCHLDVRHVLGGPATVTHPATWTYPR